MVGTTRRSAKGTPAMSFSTSTDATDWAGEVPGVALHSVGVLPKKTKQAQCGLLADHWAECGLHLQTFVHNVIRGKVADQLLHKKRTLLRTDAHEQEGMTKEVDSGASGERDMHAYALKCACPRSKERTAGFYNKSKQLRTRRSGFRFLVSDVVPKRSVPPQPKPPRIPFHQLRNNRTENNSQHGSA
eukprot:1179413-Prorocentrum_minimum.AAC.5